MAACQAGHMEAEPVPIMKISASTANGDAMPLAASAAMPAAASAMKRLTANSSFGRGTASATTPASRPNISMGA